jgi:hypothetical protein
MVGGSTCHGTAAGNRAARAATEQGRRRLGMKAPDMWVSAGGEKRKRGADVWSSAVGKKVWLTGGTKLAAMKRREGV